MNRLKYPLPKKLNHEHFCGKLELSSISDSLCQIELNKVSEKSINRGFEVNAHNSAKEFSQSFLNILMSNNILSQEDLEIIKSEDVQIVYCSQAMPHIDSFFEGSCFLSYVIETIGSPYFFGCTSDKKLSDGNILLRTQLTLNKGDWFYFDPTVAHYAMSSNPSNSQMLILAQIGLCDQSVEDRVSLISRLSPFILES